MTNASFQYWREEIADIPALNNLGEWVDLETGFTYEDYCNSIETNKRIAAPSKYESEIKAARQVAKASGFVALRGSTKQKQWAVQIRDTRLKEIQDEELKCCAGSHLFSSAKFWIESRNRSAGVIEFLIKKVNVIHKEMVIASQEYESLIPSDVKVGGRFALTPRLLELGRVISRGELEIAILIAEVGVTVNSKMSRR
jgi:hypothetical protein